MRTAVNRERLERNILEAVSSCRSGVLDTFELELGETANWKFARSRLLKVFGDRGLAGRIAEILTSEFNGGTE